MNKMTKAFFYDTLCGLVYRCMFAGLDEYGHAQWVSITPGEESKTLKDVVYDEDLGDTRFILIGLEDEAVRPEIIAKVLGKVMECPVESLESDLGFAIRRMMSYGVKWDKEPLKLEFRVFENKEYHQRQGKYSFWVEDKKDVFNILADIDGFDDLHELFDWIRTYILLLEVGAKISVIDKNLEISDKLRHEARKNDLGLFSYIKMEKEHQSDKEEISRNTTTNFSN